MLLQLSDKQVIKNIHISLPPCLLSIWSPLTFLVFSVETGAALVHILWHFKGCREVNTLVSWWQGIHFVIQSKGIKNDSEKAAETFIPLMKAENHMRSQQECFHCLWHKLSQPPVLPYLQMPLFSKS